jgi:hypothetical protein
MTAAIVSASASWPIRTVTPPTSSSIAGDGLAVDRLGRPGTGNDFRAGASIAGAVVGASTTAGTKDPRVFVSPSDAALARASRRHPNNCCGESPWRRATEHTDASLTMLSATIRAFSSPLQLRRRPAPVNTSIRRTGSMIALCSGIILNPTAKPAEDSQINPPPERWAQNIAYEKPS